MLLQSMDYCATKICCLMTIIYSRWATHIVSMVGIPVPRLSRSRCGVRSVATMKSSLEFIQGTEEICVPDVRLTRSKDGTNGTAFFRFAKPSVFEASSEMGDITG